MNDKKKIVHVMTEAPFLIGFGYQENILTVKHKELGYDVSVVSTRIGIGNQIDAMDRPKECTTEEGIKVYYLDVNNTLLRKVPIIVGWTKANKGLLDKLESLAPDIIFLHGICKYDNVDVVKYCRQNPHTKLYADNHSDFYNTPVKTLRQKIFRYGVGRYIGGKLNKYANRIWGVTPWRVLYQQQVYGISKNKSSLLVMGGDEKHINWEKRCEIKTDIRKKLGIPNDAFVVITGGKIDRTKNIHLLIDAIKDIPQQNIHLILFGKFCKDMEEYSKQMIDDRIHNVGWITPNDANDYFLSSDIACFPGTHSVLWEQACACGLPAIFKDWNGGFNHVDVGGNCIVMKNVSSENLRNTLYNLLQDRKALDKMKEIAEKKARTVFSYINIARRSIELRV